jgi:hypothetical protein
VELCLRYKVVLSVLLIKQNRSRLRLDLLGLLLRNYELQDWAGQSLSSIASELCGLITILSGTILLHTAEEGANNSAGIVI